MATSWVRIVSAIALVTTLGFTQAWGELSFKEEVGRFSILVDGEPFATYVYEDAEIPRPYFCDLYAPGGVKVTRNHPPIEGVDLTDHASYHPGLWLAFGDLGGADFWRLKASVRQESLDLRPNESSFTVTNVYEAEGRVIGREVSRFQVETLPEGRLLRWESTFYAQDSALVFGDQEEMGLGLRVATPLTVKKGSGVITNSDGFVNEAGVWGKQADWCDYSGTIDGHSVGATLFTHPDNFRRSWFHARDYGLLVANPFGRNAFTEGELSRVSVASGSSLTLRFGVFLHGKVVDMGAAYKHYVGRQ